MADNDNRNRCNTWVAGAGFGFLTLNSGLAIYRAKADLASILFVSGSYITLLLLFACLRAYERAPAMERARRAVWPLTTLLTPGFAWKVPAVMPWAVAAAVVWGMAAATTAGGFFALFLFVTVFNLALVLLFACLRAYERAPRGSPASERARRAVWSLTTLLTWKVAAFLPWAVPAAVVGSPAAIATAAGGFFALLLFACLCAYERAPVGSPAMERARRAVWLLTPPPCAGGGRPNEMHQVAAALVMAAFGTMACDAALAIHDVLADLGSSAFVFLAHVVFLVLTFRFLNAFAVAGRAQEVGHRLDQGGGGVGADHGAHGCFAG
ncbi:unnamed protein product [Urochloa humidicola]